MLDDARRTERPRKRAAIVWPGGKDSKEDAKPEHSKPEDGSKASSGRPQHQPPPQDSNPGPSTSSRGRERDRPPPAMADKRRDAGPSAGREGLDGGSGGGPGGTGVGRDVGRGAAGTGTIAALKKQQQSPLKASSCREGGKGASKDRDARRPDDGHGAARERDREPARTREREREPPAGGGLPPPAPSSRAVSREREPLSASSARDRDRHDPSTSARDKDRVTTAAAVAAAVPGERERGKGGSGAAGAKPRTASGSSHAPRDKDRQDPKGKDGKDRHDAKGKDGKDRHDAKGKDGKDRHELQGKDGGAGDKGRRDCKDKDRGTAGRDKARAGAGAGSGSRDKDGGRAEREWSTHDVSAAGRRDSPGHREAGKERDREREAARERERELKDRERDREREREREAKERDREREAKERERERELARAREERDREQQRERDRERERERERERAVGRDRDRDRYPTPSHPDAFPGSQHHYHARHDSPPPHHHGYPGGLHLPDGRHLTSHPPPPPPPPRRDPFAHAHLPLDRQGSLAHGGGTGTLSRFAGGPLPPQQQQHGGWAPGASLWRLTPEEAQRQARVAARVRQALGGAALSEALAGPELFAEVGELLATPEVAAADGSAPEVVAMAAGYVPKPRPRVADRLAALHQGPLQGAFLAQQLLPQFDALPALLPPPAVAAAAEAALPVHQTILETVARRLWAMQQLPSTRPHRGGWALMDAAQTAAFA